MGSCLTGRYLERKGVTPDYEFDARTLRIFSVGTVFEDWLVDLISKSHPDSKIETQVRVEIPKYDVTGYADVVVDNLVYEVKTKHSMGFKYLGDKPPEQNAMQLWLYLKGLDKKEGRLIYLSKDDLRTAEYVVERDDEELRDKVEEEIAILQAAWKQKLPPPVLVKDDDWRAKYCRWHKQCKCQKQYADISHIIEEGK